MITTSKRTRKTPRAAHDANLGQARRQAQGHLAHPVDLGQGQGQVQGRAAGPHRPPRNPIKVIFFS